MAANARPTLRELAAAEAERGYREHQLPPGSAAALWLRATAGDDLRQIITDRLARNTRQEPESPAA